MKSLVKVIIVCFLSLIFFNTSECLSASLKESIDSLLRQDSLSNTTLVAVSVRDVQSGTLIYQRYGNYLLHPASTLKAFTTPLALNYLGTDSYLSTNLYQSDNNVYLKLTGDPLLTRDDLVTLIKKASLKNITGNIIIDDSAIDNIPWGVGWMWDDENNSLMPKYNAYNLDHNLVTVKVYPTKSNKPVRVSVIPFYPVEVVTTATTGITNLILKKNKLNVERKPWIDSDTIFVSGITTNHKTVKLPVGNPRTYFIAQLNNALKQNNIYLEGKIINGKIPSGAQPVSSIQHKVIDVVSYTNQKSDNLGAETLLKLVGQKFSNETGSTINGLDAMKSFYDKLGASLSSQEIVDGSGASHNDLIQPNWMTKALSEIYKSPIKTVYLSTLAQPGHRGTLKLRLVNYSNKLWAKTGTLSGISGITGYLNARSGKTYAFSILIQNYKGSSTRAKNLENKIIQLINNY